MLNDLVEMLQKNTRLKAAASGSAVTSPEMQAAQKRQSAFRSQTPIQYYVHPNNMNGPNTSGIREDGTTKGSGFFGPIKRADNPDMVSTELSGSSEFKIGGKTVLYPLMQPTSTQDELDAMMKGPLTGELADRIYAKAEAHARMRISQGKSPFAQPGEQALPRPQAGAQGTPAGIPSTGTGTTMTLPPGARFTEDTPVELQLLHNEHDKKAQTALSKATARQGVWAQKASQAAEFLQGLLPVPTPAPQVPQATKQIVGMPGYNRDENRQLEQLRGE